MKSIIKSVFCVALMLVVLASCSSGKTNTNSADGASSPVAESVTNKVQFKDQQEGFKRFSYTLKEKYNSYDDIQNELANVRIKFKTHIDGCSDEYVESIKPEYTQMIDQLEKQANKYPESNEDKEDNSTTKEKFYKRVEFLDYVASTEGYVGISNDLYTKGLEIKQEYESGKIDINKAWKKIQKVKHPGFADTSSTN